MIASLHFPADLAQEAEKALDRYGQRLCLKKPGTSASAGRRCSIESTSLYPTKMLHVMLFDTGTKHARFFRSFATPYLAGSDSRGQDMIRHFCPDRGHGWLNLRQIGRQAGTRHPCRHPRAPIAGA